MLSHYSVEILVTVGRNFTIYLTNKIAKVHEQVIGMKVYFPDSIERSLRVLIL